MAKIETKVQVASLSATVSGIALWALSTWAFKGAAVPPGLVSLIYAAVPGVLALAAGYLAPHTPRPVTPVTPVTPPLPPPPATDPGGTA